MAGSDPESGVPRASVILPGLGFWCRSISKHEWYGPSRAEYPQPQTVRAADGPGLFQVTSTYAARRSEFHQGGWQRMTIHFPLVGIISRRGTSIPTWSYAQGSRLRRRRVVTSYSS
ncbi:predicted protein [Coccidioides posadasii str. Silveira]|uniref:Predicted protein n=1 Tax=Coccidioides posadasii (strain RMSCC 757 / Silveira) TaxID=443226 RepID=E9CZI1_COCPS|nr:predicted protein [Coccidioides posadasii str. Silveira]